LHLSAALARSGAADSAIIDGNLDRDFVATTLDRLGRERFDMIGVTVMGGPQLAPAITLSRAIREHFPRLPVTWGGYFPTLQTEAAIRAPYVDYVVRGPGDQALPQLVMAACGPNGPALEAI